MGQIGISQRGSRNVEDPRIIDQTRIFIKYHLSPKFRDSLSTPAQAPLSAPDRHCLGFRCRPGSALLRCGFLKGREKGENMGGCGSDISNHNNNTNNEEDDDDNDNDDDDDDGDDEDGDDDNDDDAAFRTSRQPGTVRPGNHLFLFLSDFR